MDYIVTYMGECIDPLKPRLKQIHIEDIAHSLSLLCRANGHIDRFYSVAQHCLNCAGEAKSRNYAARVQLACLLHDGSEAYIPDITKRVKFYMMQQKEIEKHMQGLIYERFLGDVICKDELEMVDGIDKDMFARENDELFRNKVLISGQGLPLPKLHSEPSFSTRGFMDVETEFLKVFYGIMHAGLIQGR